MSPSTLHIVGGDWHASSHLLHRRMYVAIGSPSMAHVLIRGTQGCLGTGRQDRAVGFALLLDGGAWSSPHIWHLSRGLAGLVIKGESALQQTCEVLVELLRGIDPKGPNAVPSSVFVPAMMGTLTYLCFFKSTLPRSGMKSPSTTGANR